MLHERKIITEHICPPIPIRVFDWRAMFDGYEPGDSLGYGSTEQEAIDDLLDVCDNEERYERA